MKPVLQSAKVLDNKTIELTYSEAITTLDAAAVGEEFILTEGTTALTLADADLKAANVSGFANKIKITIAKGDTTFDLTNDITVETTSASTVDVKDVANNVQVVKVKVTVAK